MPKVPIPTAGAVVALAMTMAAGAGAAELRLERVLLSSGGVGYFEYEAKVAGDDTLVLDVRLDQVDDVLKSLVVFDDEGGVGAASLPGRQPLQQVFRGLPFEQGDLGDPARLLNALQGAEVTVSGPRPLSGRIVSVVPESTREPDGEVLETRHRVTVSTAIGLQQFILQQADVVRFTEPELAAQVEEALAALAENRAQDRRRLRLAAPGTGTRIVRVGYVIGAPLWKASYRMIMPPAGSERPARLRGWAVLENFSGRDWDGVELTLTSGNPVTFQQALYEAYFVDRPEVPVEVIGRLLPPPDEGAMAVAGRAAPGEGRAGKAGPRPQAFSADRAMSRAEAEAPAPAPATAAQIVDAAAQEETATQVLFRLPRPVTVRAGHSLMLPLFDAELPGERISLYQPETHARHPLASVRLENRSESGLPPGILTLYEQSPGSSPVYLGDARMGALPAGEDRLLSFALDGKSTVDRSQEDSQSVVSGSIADGVLRMVRLYRRTTVYRVQAPAKEPRRVILEHDRLTDWRLVSPPPERWTQTATDYRLAFDLASGQSREIEVVMERPVQETLQLLSLDEDRIAAFARSRELEPELRSAFAEMARLQRELRQARRQLEELEQARQRLFEDQERLRQNLARTPRESDLHRRYLEKLGEQEDAIESIEQRHGEARAAVRAAEETLSGYVGRLSI